MRLPLIKYWNIALTIITTPLLSISILCAGDHGASTSGRLHSEFIRLLFLQSHRETDRFFSASGVQSPQHTSGGIYTFKRAAFLTQLKAKVGSSLAKAATMCVNLNIDGAPITSRSDTHPSHSQESRLLTSSLSLGVPVPLTMECMCSSTFNWEFDAREQAGGVNDHLSSRIEIEDLSNDELVQEVVHEIKDV